MIEQNVSLVEQLRFDIVHPYAASLSPLLGPTWAELRSHTSMPKILQKLIGLTLLFATVGVACWQALLVL